MIKITGLEKSYGNKKVLKGLQLEVPDSSVYGFVGINGAGKSTLIKCILGFVSFKNGQIGFSGQDVRTNRDYKKKLGYLPEVFQPPLSLTCHEYLSYCCSLVEGNPPTKDQVTTTLERVGLKESAQLLILKLSKGMRQRLGIGQALIHSPSLLILDEPFSGLDPIGRHELKLLLKEINNSGVTIFFSSHNLLEIQDLCSHVGILHEGEVVLNGEVESLVGQDDLEKVFLQTVGYEKEGV